MSQEALFWLFSTFFWTFVMSFYSMQEMACISCNKLRLDYYVAKNKRWAIQLNELLSKPSFLFSTTLIGVNVALMLSSESSRQLFESLGYDPNLAPLAEIPFVLIVGELVPMFAARIYPDHAARLGSPLLYLSSKILYPLNACMDLFFRYTDRFLSKKGHDEMGQFLSRDELQKLLEEHHGIEETPLYAMIGNIFTLKNKQAFQLMQKLEDCPCVSSHATIGMLRQLSAKTTIKAFCVYHKTRNKIVGMVYPIVLLNASDSKRVDDFVVPACFVTRELHALELLTHLQEEEVNEAVVLNESGDALGLITLEHLIDELFGTQETKIAPIKARLQYLEKTLDASTEIATFNEQFGTKIDTTGCESFAELIEKTLGRHPTINDTITLDSLELIVKTTSLFKAKEILIRTKK